MVTIHQSIVPVTSKAGDFKRPQNYDMTEATVNLSKSLNVSSNLI